MIFLTTVVTSNALLVNCFHLLQSTIVGGFGGRGGGGRGRGGPAGGGQRGGRGKPNN